MTLKKFDVIAVVFDVNDNFAGVRCLVKSNLIIELYHSAVKLIVLDLSQVVVLAVVRNVEHKFLLSNQVCIEDLVLGIA